MPDGWGSDGAACRGDGQISVEDKGRVNSRRGDSLTPFRLGGEEGGREEGRNVSESERGIQRKIKRSEDGKESVRKENFSSVWAAEMEKKR